MNRPHRTFVAALGAATKGGLRQGQAEAVFDGLSEFLTDLAGDSVALLEQNVRSIFNVDLAQNSSDGKEHRGAASMILYSPGTQR